MREFLRIYVVTMLLLGIIIISIQMALAHEISTNEVVHAYGRGTVSGLRMENEWLQMKNREQCIISTTNEDGYMRCASNQGYEETSSNIALYMVEELDARLAEIVEHSKNEMGFCTIYEHPNTYVVITLGERPYVGSNLIISNALATRNRLQLTVEEILPETVPAYKVRSYPYQVIRIKGRFAEIDISDSAGTEFTQHKTE